MGSDFIPDPQGVHQHSLEWPGGAYAPMHPPVSAPDHTVVYELESIKEWLKIGLELLCSSLETR